MAKTGRPKSDTEHSVGGFLIRIGRCMIAAYGALKYEKALTTL